MTVLSHQRKRLRVEPLGITLVFAGFLVWQARFAALGAALALPAGLIGAVVIDGIWSLWVTRSVRVQIIVDAPATTIEGDRVDVFLQIDTTGRRRGLLARLSFGASSPSSVSWHQLELPARGLLSATAPVRGVYQDVELHLTHTAPLGLCGVEQTAFVRLVRTMCVLPRLESLELPSMPTINQQGEQLNQRASNQPDLLRGTRPFQAGDPLRHVHWAQLARTNQLAVREFDTLSAPLMRLVVDLGPTGGERAEQVARWAAFALQRQFNRGYQVELVTRENGGVRVDVVVTMDAAGRRLASSETGEPIRVGPASPGCPVMLIGSDGARVGP